MNKNKNKNRNSDGLHSKFRTSHRNCATTCFIFLSSCVTQPTSDTSGQHFFGGQIPSPHFEVASCSPKLCGRGISVVGLNPGSDDFLFHNSGDDSSNLALDDLQNGDDVDGAEADDGLDEAAITSGVLRSLLSANNSSAVIDTGLTALFLGLSSSLKVDRGGLSIPSANISAKDGAERSKILDSITKNVNLASTLSTSHAEIPGLERSQLLSTLSAMRELSGADGWLNLGDLPRLLPVIPNVVSRPDAGGSSNDNSGTSEPVSGYAEAVVAFSEKNSASSLNWVLTADNILGRKVPRSFVAGLERTYGKHWSDVIAASTLLQSAFRDLMAHIGAKSFNLNARGKVKYYDTGAIVEGAHVDRLTRSLCGKTVHELAALSKSDPVNASEALRAKQESSPLTCVLAFAAKESLAHNIVLPDGLPVADIELIFKQAPPTAIPKFLPNIVFSLSHGGQLTISKLMTGKLPSSNNNGHNEMTR